MKQKSNLNVKINKLLYTAKIPEYAHDSDAAMDVTAASVQITDDYVEYGTGLSFELPQGYCMYIFPRSSNSKYDLLLANSVGILDSGYRGELKIRFKRVFRIKERIRKFFGKKLELSSDKFYKVGDRVAQIMIMPYPKVQFEEVKELSDTDRGTGGFGSTGK